MSDKDEFFRAFVIVVLIGAIISLFIEDDNQDYGEMNFPWRYRNFVRNINAYFESDDSQPEKVSMGRAESEEILKASLDKLGSKGSSRLIYTGDIPEFGVEFLIMKTTKNRALFYKIYKNNGYDLQRSVYTFEQLKNGGLRNELED